MESALFRLGIVDFLNAAPLHHGFLTGLGKDFVSCTRHTPADCARLLVAGQVDAGLISSIEVARNSHSLRVVPGLCVASPGKVRSVLLFSKVPFKNVQSLALDQASRSSQVLARILLRERFGVDPVVVEMPSDAESMLGACDAALLIGDPAMRTPYLGRHVLDLAEAWMAWQGLPFVFALWAVRVGAPVSGNFRLSELFHESLARGMNQLEALVQEALEKVEWSRKEVEDYFTQNITYRLQAKELESLRIYFELAANHGFAPPGACLDFLEM